MLCILSMHIFCAGHLYLEEIPPKRWLSALVPTVVRVVAPLGHETADDTMELNYIRQVNR